MAVSNPKARQRLNSSLLCLVIMIAWGVTSLPVVFFYLPVRDEVDSTGSDDVSSSVPAQSGIGPNSSEEQGSSAESGGTKNCSIVQCSEGFSCTLDTSNISICRPQCGTWMTYPYETQLAADILIAFGSITGLIAGTASLIIAGIRWRKVLIFPSVFSVYLNMSLMVLSLFCIISFVDRTALYCSSTDLQESMENPTSFCTLQGIALQYIVPQSALFWLIHVAALFFIIKFPLHAKAFREAKRFNYIHIAAVIVSLTLPTLPVIVLITAGDGYIPESFPPQHCFGRNQDVFLYTFTLEIVIISQIGITLLILLFSTIHKHYGLFQARKSNNPFSTSTAERKILISLCYYLVTVVGNTMASALIAGGADNYEAALQDYFACEALQAQDSAPGSSCDRSGYLKFTYPLTRAIFFMLAELYPVVNLLYVVDVTEIMQFFGHRSQFGAPRSSHLSKKSATVLTRL